MRVVAGTGGGGGDFGGAVGELGAGGEVERMQALMVAPGGILAHADGEECAVGAAVAVDDWRRGDADFGRDLPAAVVVAGGFARGEDGDVPELRAGVGVEGIDGGVLGGDVEDVVECVADDDVRHEERLRVDAAVCGEEADFPEGGGGYVCRSEDGLLRVEAGPREVVVPGGDVRRGSGGGGLDGERDGCGVGEFAGGPGEGEGGCGGWRVMGAESVVVAEGCAEVRVRVDGLAVTPEGRPEMATEMEPVKEFSAEEVMVMELLVVPAVRERVVGEAAREKSGVGLGVELPPQEIRSVERVRMARGGGRWREEA